MDAIDRKLINRLQEGLPIEKDPYKIISLELGIDGEELLSRIEVLKNTGYIRRIGGIFDNRAMGYTSVLVGAKVPKEIFYEAVSDINKFDGVTHNYRRDGDLNMWFTLSSKDNETRKALLISLKEKFGIEEIYEFDNLKNFKLRVFFDMEDR